jgi:cysteine desulfurase
VIDLDHNATTMPSPGVIEGVTRGLRDFWHNPSSVHRAGQSARQQVELARKEIAELIGARAREITFCSGGTEAIDLAIRGTIEAAARRDAEPPIVVSTKIEHAAVRDLWAALERRGAARVRWAPISREGLLDLAAFDGLLEGATMASIQWANNETGVIQDIAAIAERCRTRKVLLHVDGTQWVGKEPTEIAGSGVDVLTFSPHKWHGPKGVGVLWARGGVRLAPQVVGTQEMGRRGGTENVPGIIGAGVAARETREWLRDASAREAQARLRDRFESIVLEGVAGAAVNGTRTRRLWNTTNIAFPRLEAEALLMMLSERGVCASAGAACSSGSLDPSPVLLVMGVPAELAHGSLRFSLGRETTQGEIDEGARIVIECAKRLGAALPPSRA